MRQPLITVYVEGVSGEGSSVVTQIIESALTRAGLQCNVQDFFNGKEEKRVAFRTEEMLLLIQNMKVKPTRIDIVEKRIERPQDHAPEIRIP